MALFARRSQARAQAPMVVDVVTEPAPDRLGARLAQAFDLAWGASLAGMAAPRSVRAGMRGDPAVTFAGDLGPLQNFGARAVGAVARSGMRVGAASSQALPGTKGPLVAPITIQDRLGPGL